ncbi:leucine-rich repeat neuronal protein 1-like [Daktulosphaira vitifoliae]|uniref:leucine-rich repeat neuronal protein 1-like n=1 Tax=Daktulosphaira vitifoliae TaxID=58002 RepID=UPI0021AAE594|nr:leucine-rich repeat neuronal protein 1-like [Daktulosphaira vitifoliae]
MTRFIILCFYVLLLFFSKCSALYKVKCYEQYNGKDPSGIMLDCANIRNHHPNDIEMRVRYHAHFSTGGLKSYQIVEIDMTNNNLEHIFKLPLMDSLKKLSFKYNNISSINHQAFSDLPALEELDLSFNSLTSEQLKSTIFRKVTTSNTDEQNPLALKVLKLGHNNIHSLQPNCFENFINLETLELNNNPFLFIDQNTEISLNLLHNLKTLHLANVGLSKFPEDSFTQTNIEVLYLNGNDFTTVPKGIVAMPLAFLNLNANPISDLNSGSFIGLDKLQQLIISSMPFLTNIESGTFAPLPKLITLQMSYNPKLNFIHYDAFRNASMKHKWSLRQLFLNNNALSYIDSKLCPWPKLDTFDAKSNPWICDCNLSWMANYINKTFKEVPENFLYYRCNEPENLIGILVSQLNEHINCSAMFTVTVDHSHEPVTRLRQFIIVVGLVIGIFVFGTLINMSCRKFKKILKPRINSPVGFSSGVKYRPADFEENSDFNEDIFTRKMPSKIYGRPIVINK